MSKSLAMGLFPKSLKRAKILPIFQNVNQLVIGYKVYMKKFYFKTCNLYFCNSCPGLKALVDEIILID